MQFISKRYAFICGSVQFSSVAQSCPTLCDPMNRSTPGLPVHHQLPVSSSKTPWRDIRHLHLFTRKSEVEKVVFHSSSIPCGCSSSRNSLKSTKSLQRKSLTKEAHQALETLENLIPRQRGERMVRPGGRREDGGQCIEMSLLSWNGECLKGWQGERELGKWAEDGPSKVILLSSCSVMSDSLQHHGLQHTRLPCPSQSLKLMSIEWVMPSKHLILCLHSPVFNLFQHLGLFQWGSSSYQVAKVLEFQLQHQSFQWIFRVYFLYDWLV